MNDHEDNIWEMVWRLGGDDYVEIGNEIHVLKNGKCIAIIDDKNKEKSTCVTKQ